MSSRKPGLQGVTALSAIAKRVVKSDDRVSVAPEAFLDVAKIDVHEQVRKEFVDLDDLAQSIVDLGILSPLLVHEEPNGRFRLICGERRLRAARMVGLDKVPVLIQRGKTEAEIRKAQITENMERSNLTLKEQCLGVLEDVQKYGADQAQKIWNKSQPWISKRVTMKDLGPETRVLFDDGHCEDVDLLISLNQLEGLGNDRQLFSTFVGLIRKGETVSRESVRKAVQQARLRLEREASAGVVKSADAYDAASSPAQERVQGIIDSQRATDALIAEAEAELQGSTAVLEDTPAERDTNEASRGAVLAKMRKDAVHAGSVAARQVEIIETMAQRGQLTHDEADWEAWQILMSNMKQLVNAMGPQQKRLVLHRLRDEIKGTRWIDGLSSEAMGKVWSDMPSDWRL